MKPLTKSALRSFLSIGVVVALLAGGPDIRAMLWSVDGAPPAVAEDSTAELTRFYPTGAPRKSMIFYMVDSDELSAAVREAEERTLTELIAAGDEFPKRSYGLYLVETPRDEVSFNRMVSDTIDDLSIAGLVDVLVIDLRSN